ncbi:MAG: aldehyde dehydrogenase [Bacteroidetes bacterium]|jgi:acyl-CoA reductase-like NAD-dependent aldehyde dehydrogenase|nr:MAG: aldehyde dehydrogenase [Bacteroidota bacterium]PTM19820.1 MAG: aldehyde dehydrogenase [Bacteroidota bacterium]
MNKRLNVRKTYKNFIGGAFVRSESGHVYGVTGLSIPPDMNTAQEKANPILAQACRSTRKDIREAVVHARKAQNGWASKTAYLRGQIIYRIAEMLEDRKANFTEELTWAGISKRAAAKQVETSIDRLVYYAGWTDKLSQVFGSVNPVATPHFNFSTPEPLGVVAIFCADESPLLSAVTAVAAICTGGNSAVLIPSQAYPLSALSFGEVLHSSDVPPGVVNILSGIHNEIMDPLASHMDVNGICNWTDHPASQALLDEHAARNIKRITHQSWGDGTSDEFESPYLMMQFQEIKTTWHPVGY